MSDYDATRNHFTVFVTLNNVFFTDTSFIMIIYMKTNIWAPPGHMIRKFNYGHHIKTT